MNRETTMITRRATTRLIAVAAALGAGAPFARAIDTGNSLSAGTTAFVRVKQYAPLSGKPTIQDMFGGVGYVLRNLNPSGIEAPIAKSAPNAVTVAFGDTVTLVEKQAGVPTMWVVAKGQTKIQLPEYLLTTRKEEIDYLTKAQRIPESMVFVYSDKGHIATWGVMVGGIGRFHIIESHGLALLDYPEGTSPFAVKGNAVLFDQSEVKGWDKPPVFDSNKKALELSASCLYYCVSDGDKPAFELIELKNV
jgi:hypothetical protein